MTRTTVALLVSLGAAGLGSVCASARAQAPAAPLRAPAVAASASTAAPPLDWNAGWRWVHIDTIDAAQVELFESARRRWLKRLDSAGGGWLPDGRPLFWTGRRAPGDPLTCVTLYPYASWQDLTARTEAAERTQARVGAPAVADYDSGDAALVPPHRSELWRRLPDMDIAPARPIASEPEGRSALLERRQMPSGASSPKLDALWPRVTAALTRLDYPATCRASWGLYGDGDLVLFCLSQTDVPPTSISDALAAHSETATLAGELDALLPLHDRLMLVRRDDLSHLPPGSPR